MDVKLVSIPVVVAISVGSCDVGARQARKSAKSHGACPAPSVKSSAGDPRYRYLDVDERQAVRNVALEFAAEPGNYEFSF